MTDVCTMCAGKWMWNIYKLFIIYIPYGTFLHIYTATYNVVHTLDFGLRGSSVLTI